MSKSDAGGDRFRTYGGHSPWGTSRELQPDGTYICEDASGAWYLDPVTGETDIIAFRSTQWYSEKYRRSYVEARLRDATPFADWDVRGQREWIQHAEARRWPRPPDAPELPDASTESSR
jgi:hypothetical protein